MMQPWPRAWGSVPGAALIRCCPQDFKVNEELGFELSGEGEHVFLYLRKRQLNTLELVERLGKLSGVAERDIGYSGLKDRNAVTRQWISLGMAGRPEPDWGVLEQDGNVEVLEVARHSRKLRRGVHRANRFTLVLRELVGEPAALEQRLGQIRDNGVPNYFGEQRFGRNGSTLEQARRWLCSGRKISRNKRSLYFSALRAFVFNQLLAARVESGSWNRVVAGDVCLLRGTRSFFSCDEVNEDIRSRVAAGDLHPGLPLWGNAKTGEAMPPIIDEAGVLSDCRDICEFLEKSDLALAWRPARLLPDDFHWQFCDDGSLQLDFALGAGSYATAVLAEFVHYTEKEKKKEGKINSGIGSEQG